MEKCNVNGPDCHDVYKYLRTNSELYDKDKQEAREIPWNFAKFLIDKDGNVVKYYGPKIEPNDIIPDFKDKLKMPTSEKSEL